MQKHMKTGVKNRYHWLVSHEEIIDIDQIVIEYHSKYTLYLATFDSGPLLPNTEEIAQGWQVEGEIMVSPPLSSTVVIPYEQYDEWYLSKNKLKFPTNLERYVNYCGFSLCSDNVENETSNPTMEKQASNSMQPLQDEFWKQLLQISPHTFIAIGDNDILVSRDEALIKHVATIA